MDVKEDLHGNGSGQVAPSVTLGTTLLFAGDPDLWSVLFLL